MWFYIGHGRFHLFSPFMGGTGLLVRLFRLSHSFIHSPTSLRVPSVTDDELSRLFKRFTSLDTDNSGTLSVEEFMAIPELEHNPLVRRVIATFDTDNNGEIDFKEFLQALAVFAKKEDNQEDKYRCRFYFVFCVL